MLHTLEQFEHALIPLGMYLQAVQSVQRLPASKRAWNRPSKSVSCWTQQQSLLNPPACRLLADLGLALPPSATMRLSQKRQCLSKSQRQLKLRMASGMLLKSIVCIFLLLLCFPTKAQMLHQGGEYCNSGNWCTSPRV